MTVFTTNTAHSAALQHGFLDGLRTLVTGLTAGYSAYRLYGELNGKSDRELADIGLSRADLPGVVAGTIAR